MSMRTWSVGLGMLVGLGLLPPLGVGDKQLSLGWAPAAQAGKGKEKKMKFEIYEDKAKEYRWRLKAPNGLILATSGEGYKNKADCKKLVEQIQAGVAKGKYEFELYVDKAKEHRWRLKAPSGGKIVGASSEGYKAKADAQKAIDSIKAGAAKADVEEVK